jgi:hypothetical protein
MAYALALDELDMLLLDRCVFYLLNKDVLCH